MASIVYHFCVLCVLALLQPPAPGPGEASQAPQNQGGSKSGGARKIDDAGQSRSTAISKVQANSNAAQRDNQGDKGNSPSFTDWCLTVFTGLLAIFAYLQYRVYAKQAGYMRDNIAIAKDTVEQMRLEQRAWLSASIECEPLVAGKVMQCWIVVENLGRTPGTIKCTASSIFDLLSPVDLDDTFKRHQHGGKLDIRDHVVAPLSKTRFFVNPMQTYSLGECVIESLYSGARILVIIARFEYKDVTGCLRETQIFMAYDGPTKQFHICEKYNYMT